MCRAGRTAANCNALREFRDESQRDSGTKPRVARNELPRETWPKANNPNGVAARRPKPDATPLGLEPTGRLTQGRTTFCCICNKSLYSRSGRFLGSSFLAIPRLRDWRTQSLWDCSIACFFAGSLDISLARNFRKSLRLTRNRHFGRGQVLNLTRDLERQVQRAHRRLAIDERLLLFANAFDKMVQLQLERLLFRDRHRLAHDFLPA